MMCPGKKFLDPHRTNLFQSENDQVPRSCQMGTSILRAPLLTTEASLHMLQMSRDTDRRRRQLLSSTIRLRPIMNHRCRTCRGKHKKGSDSSSRDIVQLLRMDHILLTIPRLGDQSKSLSRCSSNVASLAFKKSIGKDVRLLCPKLCKDPNLKLMALVVSQVSRTNSAECFLVLEVE